MKHKFVGLGFFLFFLGLILFILAINFFVANPGPPGSHTGWSLVGLLSSLSLLMGALILFIKLLVFLVDKLHPAKVQSQP